MSFQDVLSVLSEFHAIVTKVYQNNDYKKTVCLVEMLAKYESELLALFSGEKEFDTLQLLLKCYVLAGRACIKNGNPEVKSAMAQ